MLSDKSTFFKLLVFSALVIIISVLIEFEFFNRTAVIRYLGLSPLIYATYNLINKSKKGD